MLTGKTIVLGVTGGIAAYKSANLASMLIKLHADVHVIMTQNATKFITPMTFETLTNNKCIVDTFDRNFSFDVKHVSLAKRGDLFVVAPCTANVIGKLAHGICDDMLTTTMLATRAPKLIAPAMNTGMWENPILQDNLVKLEHDLKGKRFLITAGPTQESIDPVRYITNHSSGKMGYAIAKMARLRGAEVTLVSGPVNIKAFEGINVVPVKSAKDMFDAVTTCSTEADVVIMCSAVADYTPAEYSDQKVKKHDGDMAIQLTRTQDILGWLGEHKENLIENSRAKLDKKHADMICANSIADGNTGFAVDTNKVTIITNDAVTELPLCSKEETADKILSHILTL